MQVFFRHIYYIYILFNIIFTCHSVPSAWGLLGIGSSLPHDPKEDKEGIEDG